MQYGEYFFIFYLFLFLFLFFLSFFGRFGYVDFPCF